MSEASRAAALAHAATVHHGSADPQATLQAAEAFHAFIVANGEAAPAKPVKLGAAAKQPKPIKQPQPVAPPVEEEEADEPAEGVTKEQVGEAVEALLNANLRNQAIALFKKFNAKSLSGISPADYAAAKQEAEDLLLNS